MTVEIKVLGLQELRKALLETVPEHFQGKVLQKALAAGSKPIVRAAQALAPQGKTGVLRRSIYAIRAGRDSNGIYEQRNVTVRSGKKYQKSNRDAYYWRWVEFGRGVVRAGHRVRKGALGNTRDSTTDATVLGTPEKGFFGADVRAVSPRPFLRPAFDRNKETSVELIRRDLAEEIPKAARKARWPTPSR